MLSPCKDLAQYDVKFTGIVESTFLRDLLGWVVPAVVFVAIWIFVMRRFADTMGGGGFMNIGKLMTRAELKNRMMVLLGGRAAEELAFGHHSTGAADDLQKVTAAAPVLPLPKAA